jgi:penicillin-binding protein 1A
MKRLFGNWLHRRSIGQSDSSLTSQQALNPTAGSEARLSRKQLFLYALLGAGALGAIMALLIVIVLVPTLPSVENIAEGRLKVPMRVYSVEGRLLGEFGEERRIPVAMVDVPQDLVNAILAAEDAEFYNHWGVDFRGVARAMVANMRSGGRRQGASTITMQVARNFFLSPEKTWTRKLREVLLAFKIEYALTKDEILELYINKIFLGHRAYGFAAAAQIYYGKSLPDLLLQEKAMLAALPKAPSRNNPISNPDNALERRNYVLSRMAKLEYISEELLQESRAAPITASKHRFEYDVKAPYVAEMVRRYMYQAYAEKTYAGGYHVYTTIVAENQNAANRAVHKGLLAYDERQGYRGAVNRVKLHKKLNKDFLDATLKDYRTVGGLSPAIVLVIGDQNAVAYTQDGYVIEIGWEGLKWAKRFRSRDYQGSAPKKTRNVLRPGDVVYVEHEPKIGWKLVQVPEVAGALVSIRPQDGAILALTGGFDFHQSKFNRITQAERQPGSNIKPFIYSAAIAKGYTAASTVSGAPIVIEDKNLEGEWKPENYSGKFFGPTRLRLALTKSMNLVSVRLLRSIGANYAVSYLQRFGFAKEKIPNNLSLALGSASFTPLEVASGFSVFASGGYRAEPYFITRVEDAEGNILEQANPTRVCPQCPETETPYTDPVDSMNREQANAGAKDKPMADAVGAGESLLATPVESEATVAAVEQGSVNEPEEIQPRYAPRVISAENAFIMTSIMRDVVKFGTGRRALALKRNDLAGKTGTTNEFRDAWFSGFNGNVVTTAWVGFDQPEPLGRHESGAKAALPIWVDFMRVALKDMDNTDLEQPAGVVTVMVDAETGEYVGPVPDEDAIEATPEEESPEENSVDELPDTLTESTETTEESGSPQAEKTDKPEPIMEYFIAGTEPKGMASPSDATETDNEEETKPKPTQGDQGLEGLF